MLHNCKPLEKHGCTIKWLFKIYVNYLIVDVCRKLFLYFRMEILQFHLLYMSKKCVLFYLEFSRSGLCLDMT